MSEPQTEAHFQVAVAHYRKSYKYCLGSFFSELENGRRDLQYQVFIGRLNEENLPCQEKRNQLDIYRKEDSLQARLYCSLLRLYEYTKHFNPDRLQFCTGSQLKFPEVYIPQYDGPYRYVLPQRVWFSFWSKNGYYTIAFYCPFWFSTKPRESVSGGKGGAAMTALASQQCGPGSNPGVDAICGLSLLLVLSLAPRGFSPGSGFPLSSKANTSKFQFDLERTDTFKRVHMNS